MDKPDKQGENQCDKPSAIEMNPDSEQVDPGKYFAYTREAMHTTCFIIAKVNDAVIKVRKKARSMALRHLPRALRVDVHWFSRCARTHDCECYV